MTEMVERVARAICVSDGENPDTTTPYNPNVEKLWQYYIPSAVAAIKAMRDPTESMIEAMDEHAGTIAPQYAYEAAIDAALSGEGR